MCKNKENNQAKCDVHCIFFPDMTCSSWKYDEKEPYSNVIISYKNEGDFEDED